LQRRPKTTPAAAAAAHEEEKRKKRRVMVLHEDGDDEGGGGALRGVTRRGPFREDRRKALLLDARAWILEAIRCSDASQLLATILPQYERLFGEPPSELVAQQGERSQDLLARGRVADSVFDSFSFCFLLSRAAAAAAVAVVICNARARPKDFERMSPACWIRVKRLLTYSLLTRLHEEIRRESVVVAPVPNLKDGDGDEDCGRKVACIAGCLKLMLQEETHRIRLLQQAGAPV